ncbi:MAG: MBL fold metallo-hydrolase [Prevotellaceae bacterium]|jgi:glyoxylase-like metal-dependent hydrolase (beta-lactamase superfamily II)|nr:MBL fold metallo-hydrolase [Prevotellaceae bacterium]
MKKHTLLLIGIMATISACSQSVENGTAIGNYKIYTLSEGQQQGNSSILLDATPEMMAQAIPDGTFPNAVNAFLVQTPDKNILVDAGFGRLLFDNLKSIGLTATQIDVVLLTHLHGDHIGGLLKNGKITFPNAQIYIAKSERDYWAKTDNALALNVLKAYEKQIVLFEPNDLGNIKTALFAGITPIAAFGHTPGHTAFLVESDSDKLLIWGDLTHAMAIQMPFPQVAVTYDINPKEAVTTRQAILKFVAENHIRIAGMHIAAPSIGKIEAKGDGFEFVSADEIGE